MVELMIFSGYLCILGIGGIVSDYIFPHIKPLAKFIDSLPLMEEEDANEPT